MIRPHTPCAPGDLHDTAHQRHADRLARMAYAVAHPKPRRDGYVIGLQLPLYLGGHGKFGTVADALLYKKVTSAKRLAKAGTFQSGTLYFVYKVSDGAIVRRMSAT